MIPICLALATLLAQDGRLQVNVRDPRGAPVAEAEVQVTLAAGGKRTVRSDAGGVASFVALPAGGCRISVAVRGFQTWQGTCPGEGGQTVEARLAVARLEERVEVKESAGRRFVNWLTSCMRKR